MIKILLGKVRYDKHITLRQLERYTGLSRSYINDIENGLSKPTLEAMCSLARALQVPVTDLFEDTNEIKA